MGDNTEYEQLIAADKRIAELEARLDRAENMQIECWHCTEKDKRISELEAQIKAWMTQSETYADALREIAEHPHCEWDTIPVEETKWHCDFEGRDGHRCAAEIARRAREGKR